MLGRTHLIFSSFLLILFFYFYHFDILNNLFLVSMFLFSSIFPDIDNRRSILGRRIKLFSYLFKHRGFLHSIWALILFSGLIFLLNAKLGLVFMAGYLLHLILDGMTREGISFFSKRVRGPIVVGSVVEHTIYLSLLLLSLFLILASV